MITYLTGVPGSGKTYKAVLSIFNNFSDDLKAKKDIKKDYYYCYTNINELKFDKLHDTFPLDFDDLKTKLKQLHKLYKNKATDEELIEKCTEFKLYKCLIVIDEAHNIFDTNDAVLIWWLSYHRHLYHDIFLITQNLSLIFSKYKAFSEYFFKAKSTTISLNRNTFKYDVYINSRMAMNSRSHTEKLSKLQEVFDLYQSGDSVGAKNVLLKFYIFAFSMLVLASLFAYFYFSPKSATKEEIVTHQEEINVASQHQTNYSQSAPAVEEKFKYEDKKFFKLTCNTSNCFNEDVLLPVALLTYFIKSNNVILLHSEKINSNNYKFYASCSNDFYQFISKKGLQSEKNSPSVDSIVPNFDIK